MFRALYPRGGEVEIEDHVCDLDLRAGATPERPYTVANFVSTVDGRASFQGRSGALGDQGDKAMFRALRGAVDAVLVGTGTLQGENYGRLIRDPDARSRRRAEGLSDEPLACTVTRSGRLPVEIPLFAEPEAKVIVFSSREIDLKNVAAQVEVVRIPEDKLSFAAALAHLRGHQNVHALLCEGGPTVFSGLLSEGVVDELFLTLAPKLVGGGDEPAITGGPELPELADVRLAGVLEREGTLFLRYKRRI
ncbi:MAG: dihydrofolate reductase family protein [Solirubrobacteraceae bacterium]